MDRRLVLLAIVWVGVLAAVGAGVLLGRHQEPEPAPVAVPGGAAASTPAVGPRRTRLPRPARAKPVSAPVEQVAVDPVPDERVPATAAEREAVEPDEAPPVPLSGDALVDALNATKDEGLFPAAAHCIPGAGLPSEFTGKLQLELVLDDQGLTDATVADLGANDVAFPQSMLDCLSDAVWGQDWPAATEDTTVHYPLMVTTD